MKATQKDREEFVALIQQHAGGNPNARLDFARQLMRHGATHSSYWLAYSCGPDTDTARKYSRTEEDFQRAYKRIHSAWENETIPRLEKRMLAARVKVHKLCKDFDCKALFSGDPRGYTIKVIVPSGKSNSFAGEGIGVPTS